MFIGIDVGNTNVHLGVWESGRWAHHWRARTVADKMPDEYAVLVRNFFDGVGIGWRMVSGVAISSVVPPLTLAFAEMVRRYGKIEPVVVTAQTPTGIGIAVDQPEQVGADRIVNSAAAFALYGSPAIVIDFGTATTFDVISGGAYRGGAIAPGLNLAHDALVSRAARLHKIDLQPPPSPIGSNTIHAMQSGIFLGYVALVEGLVRRISAAMDEDAAPVIATGGLAPLFDQHTDVIDHIAPALTLDGLRIIHALNHTR